MPAFFQGLVVALREGVEAALLVALMLAALNRTGRESLRGAIYAGVATAALSSLAGAALLQRLAVNEEAFEGFLYLAAAAMVATMLVWMHRHARGLRGEIDARVEQLRSKGSAGAWAGLFLFCFLSVFREGVETVLFLGALGFSTEGVSTAAGALLGFAVAVAFAVFFIRGSLKVDLPRFFRVTTILLAVLVAQLLLNGVHELSEAGLFPSGPRLMALVGPVVRHNTLFLAAMLLAPVLLLLTAGDGSARKGPPLPQTPADRRREVAAAGRARRGRILGAGAGMAIVLLLGLDTLVLSRPKPVAAPQPVTLADGKVSLALAGLPEGELRRFAVPVAGRRVRFLLLRRSDGRVVSAFDACLLCGDRGYTQEGAGVVCINCSAEINVATIGEPGGCNPIPLPTRVEGPDVVVAEADLAAGAGHFSTPAP